MGPRELAVAGQDLRVCKAYRASQEFKEALERPATKVMQVTKGQKELREQGALKAPLDRPARPVLKERQA